MTETIMGGIRYRPKKTVSKSCYFWHVEYFAVFIVETRINNA